MTRPMIKRRHTDLQLESVARISSFPIVESSIYIAGNVYEKIKRSNSLMNWGLDTAEQSLAMATATAMPAIIALNMPIATIDHLLCRGIDIVEQRVPVLHLPPHLMYWNTREYVNNKFVKPVLIRADSVKMIGSQAANAAVERLAGAINVADQYVDRYLPADPADKIAECKKPIKTIACTDSTDGAADETSNKAVRTIEHGARFSRKLQRRLTRRTLAEARALKEQGTECIHVLLYVVELLATDPKLALQKAKELWASLSGPEPENQARPTNLEQLLVLFTRETARRIVHLVNGTTNLAARSPRRLARALLRLSHRLIAISEQALKVTTESIYRLLTDVLVITSGSLSYRHHHQQQQLHQQQHRLTTLSLPKRKLFFQTTNGTCSTPGCTAGAAAKAAAAAAAAGGNGSGGSYLSLIAKINIVPLSRVAAKLSSSPSSFIEELRSGDNDDDDDDDGRPEIGNEQKKVLDVGRNRASEFGNLHSILHDDVFANAKDSHPMLRPIFVKSKKPVTKSSLAYKTDSILPMKINKYGEKRMPAFAKIKPMPAIKHKISEHAI